MHVEHLPTPRQLLLPVVLLIVGCCLGLGAGPESAIHALGGRSSRE
jgi:hypothetical protein